MRHGRRVRPDPLLPVSEPRWLVVRDQLSQAIAWNELQPLTDLQAVLEQKREQRRLDGWSVEDISPATAFFFCGRGGERHCISIESYAPGTVPTR